MSIAEERSWSNNVEKWLVDDWTVTHVFYTHSHINTANMANEETSEASSSQSVSIVEIESITTETQCISLLEGSLSPPSLTEDPSPLLCTNPVRGQHHCWTPRQLHWRLVFLKYVFRLHSKPEAVQLIYMYYKLLILCNQHAYYE